MEGVGKLTPFSMPSVEFDRAQVSYNILRKTRESLRDCLYLKYQEQWREHDRGAGKFFDSPSDADKALLNFLMAYADGDEFAVEATKHYDQTPD